MITCPSQKLADLETYEQEIDAKRKLQKDSQARDAAPPLRARDAARCRRDASHLRLSLTSSRDT